MAADSNRFLESLTIKNFLCFGDEPQRINFGTLTEKKTSALTVVVGEISSGKSTIIKSLIGMKTYPFNHEQYPNQKTLITVGYGGEKYFYTRGDRKFSLGMWTDEQEVTLQRQEYRQRCRFVILNTRSYCHSCFKREIKYEYENNHLIESNPPIEQFCYVPLLQRILQEEKYRNEFYEIIKALIPKIKGSFKIDVLKEPQSKKDMTCLIYQLNNEMEQTGSSLSDGFLSLLIIAANLITCKEDGFPLIIDGPESGLHPDAQKRLASVLSERAKFQQIIIITHSPYFINFSDFLNGASFIRLNLHDNSNCRISALQLFKNESESELSSYAKFIRDNIKEYQKPQLLDEVFKEIFFSEKILIFEGLEDVGILRNWLRDEYRNIDKKNKFNILGYGVGGVGNIPTFLDMAKDLGIKKVAVLTDSLNGKEGSDDLSKCIDKWKKQNKELCKTYLFHQLLTKDIRDYVDFSKLKKIVEKKIKNKMAIDDVTSLNECVEIKDSGSFDKNGKIKKCRNCDTEHEFDLKNCEKECNNAHLIKIFDEFNIYFKIP